MLSPALVPEEEHPPPLTKHNKLLLSHGFPGILSIFNLFQQTCIQVFPENVPGSVERNGIKVPALNKFTVQWGVRENLTTILQGGCGVGRARGRPRRETVAMPLVALIININLPWGHGGRGFAEVFVSRKEGQSF